MSIGKKVNWDVIPENFLLEIFPENDPKYGGDKETALKNARRAYIYFKNFYHYQRNSTESEDSELTSLLELSTLDDKELMRNIAENSEDRKTLTMLIRNLYQSKELRDLWEYAPPDVGDFSQ